MKTASAYQSIVVLTGAGVSAESGLATFRDSNGLWNNHRIEDVATPEAFERNPTLVWEFYSARRRNALSVSPNAAHHALASFSRACRDKGIEFTLVTQNVDGLHRRGLPGVHAPAPAGRRRAAASHKRPVDRGCSS